MNGFINGVKKDMKNGYDGFLEDTICDPSLPGAKEIASVPVIEFGEALVLCPFAGLQILNTSGEQEI
ncbi:MAG: hypothetical protein QXJ62_02395 [Nitrososphaeria archaeon]